MALDDVGPVLVTGGCGFIGANFLNLFVPSLPQIRFVNIDSLTYAGNPNNLATLSGLSNYEFIKADLRDAKTVQEVLMDQKPRTIIHFAAESHVDRSINEPALFVETNVIGTCNLLNSAMTLHRENSLSRFHHVSTDEVYGSLGSTGFFQETTPYDPRSPYSASKAASDHLVRAYGHTFHLPFTITNCSNNYGPYQFPEKLIPLVIHRCLNRQSIPVYGDGSNVRDWLHVSDHCEAIWKVVLDGREGETYNIGGNSERTNLQVVSEICKNVAELTNSDEAELTQLITFVTDRPGHDQRYAIDPTKVKTELGWEPKFTFEQGLRDTVAWYLSHQDWVEQIDSGEYRNWIDKNYKEREINA